ncbi:MAG: M13 family metallopeptidase [Bryobacteraceae bacterium]|jgi:putative endopeptidase
MKLHWLFASLLFPLAALAADPPAASGLDTAAMNKSIDPCTDFYQYACGNWVAHNPLPADRSRWGRFNELSDHNEHVLLDMIQGAVAKTAGRNEIEQKIGDEYAACMDTAAIEKNGLGAIEPELARIKELTVAGMVDEVARLHGMGVPALFVFGAGPDAKDSNQTIANFRQGGLSLPDRSYYLKTDAKSVETRQRFVEHMANMFRLAGDSPEAAVKNARLTLDFETALAKDSVDRVAMRDPNATYHIMTRQELQALTSSFFNWNEYWKQIEAPPFQTLNVSQPAFAKGLAADLPNQSVDAWKAYFEYHLLRAHAEQLPAAFESEAFDFWQRYMTGAQEQRPRPYRCVRVVDRELGDLLGQKYIELTFGPAAKAQITQLVTALEKALAKDIQALDWMSADTKRAAIAKLNAITNNVGYPKTWRDYSKVKIARDDFLGNAERVAEFRYRDNIGKIGKPTDKTEWSMSTPTVNAFYSPQNNSINFPAGILQSPFFDPQRDMSINYGAVGAVIGHEMTHGFDDQGRKFDGDGNLRDWWTATDGAEFEKRAACVADEYSGFTAVDDVKLNGRLTLGENTADNGGLRIAYMALEDTLKGNAEKMDGYTPEQRFFLGWAQVWCENTAPQEARNRAVTDPHSPGRFRVNGTLQNMPEFQKAYACKASQPMVSPNACRVW